MKQDEATGHSLHMDALERFKTNQVKNNRLVAKRVSVDKKTKEFSEEKKGKFDSMRFKSVGGDGNAIGEVRKYVRDMRR